MIERIYILCLIIIIKSEVWTITHCLGLGHETMVCAVCLSVFFKLKERKCFNIFCFVIAKKVVILTKKSWPHTYCISHNGVIGYIVKNYLLIFFRVASLALQDMGIIDPSELWPSANLRPVWRRTGDKPLPEPAVGYCELDSWEQISVKSESEFHHFHSTKCIWKCCLPILWPFSPGADELNFYLVPNAKESGGLYFGMLFGDFQSHLNIIFLSIFILVWFC